MVENDGRAGQDVRRDRAVAHGQVLDGNVAADRIDRAAKPRRVEEAKARGAGEVADRSPVCLEGPNLQGIRIQAGGVRRANERPRRGARDDRRADVPLEQDLEDAHVRGTEDAAAAEGQSQVLDGSQVHVGAHVLIVGAAGWATRG